MGEPQPQTHRKDSTHLKQANKRTWGTQPNTNKHEAQHTVKTNRGEQQHMGNSAKHKQITNTPHV